MSFSEQLRTEASPLFDAIYHHPFVQDIAHECLPREAIIHYVKQDTQYLNTYARVYGLAVAKAHNARQMQLFHQRMENVLNGEMLPHRNLCRVADVSYEDLRLTASMAPTAHHYAGHMLASAYAGSLLEIVAAVLPCHWTYVDLATRIHTNFSIADHPDHAFYDWISFYAGPALHAGLDELTTMFDDLAQTAGEREKQSARLVFLDGCRLELRFFEMAYTQEAWRG